MLNINLIYILNIMNKNHYFKNLIKIRNVVVPSSNNILIDDIPTNDNKIIMLENKMLQFLENFKGYRYTLANNWFMYPSLNVLDFENKPINYLEIGPYYGANLLSVANSYCLHSDSKLYCIDPWEEENEDSDLDQESVYEIFNENIKNSSCSEKIISLRGYSNIEILKFEDNLFDLIYIDGNSDPEYVLEDAVLSFRKLKKNGILIFNNYCSNNIETDTINSIDSFIGVYSNKITKIGLFDYQMIIQKL
jgi:predicted O-methyltransferase YrrM